MRRYLATITLITCVLIMGGWSVAHSQSRHLSAENIGMGGGGTAYVNDYHANFINPANLRLNAFNEPRLSVGLLGGMNVTAGGSLLNLSVYNKYLTSGDTLKGQRLQDFLGDWFGSSSSNERRVAFNVDVVPIAGAWNGAEQSFSFAIRTRSMTDVRLSRGFVEMGLSGLDSTNFSQPKDVNMHIRTTTFNEISVGYARKVYEQDGLFGFTDAKVYAGIAPKLLLGTHATTFDFNSTMQVEGDNRLIHDFDYSIQTVGSTSDQLNDYYNARQGSDSVSLGDYLEGPSGQDFYGVKAVGFGVDLGATIEFDLTNYSPAEQLSKAESKKLRVGLSITDIGAINYSDGRDFRQDAKLDWRGIDFDPQRVDAEFDSSFSDYFDYVMNDSIQTQIYGGFEPEGNSGISRNLPTMINLGSQLQLDRFSFAMDLGIGTNNVGVNSKRMSLALGSEYKFFGFLPVRVGLRTGGYSAGNYSFGTGLEFENFEFTLGIMSVGMDTESLNASFAWSGLVFRF